MIKARISRSHPILNFEFSRIVFISLQPAIPSIARVVFINWDPSMVMINL